MHEKKSNARYYQKLLHRHLVFKPKLTVLSTESLTSFVSSFPGIFSRSLRFFYVASSPCSSLPHLLDRHRKLVGSSAIPARSCPGPVRYHWRSIVELEVPPRNTRIDDTPPPQHQRITKHHVCYFTIPTRLFVCLFVCLFVGIKPEKLYSTWEGREPPGSDRTRAEAQTTCVPKTDAQPRHQCDSLGFLQRCLETGRKKKKETSVRTNEFEAQ